MRLGAADTAAAKPDDPGLHDHASTAIECVAIAARKQPADPRAASIAVAGKATGCACSTRAAARQIGRRQNRAGIAPCRGPAPATDPAKTGFHIVMIGHASISCAGRSHLHHARRSTSRPAVLPGGTQICRRAPDRHCSRVPGKPTAPQKRMCRQSLGSRRVSVLLSCPPRPFLHPRLSISRCRRLIRMTAP